MNWRKVLVVAAVSLTQQVLLTVGGQIVPDDSGIYGAPIPVGRAMDLIGLSSASFLLPIWIINVVVTCTIVWFLAVWLGGRLWRGLIAVTVGTLIGLVIVGVGHQFQLLGWEVRLLPLWSWAQVLVWLLGLGSIALAWGTL
jgi:hypothetical protein